MLTAFNGCKNCKHWYWGEHGYPDNIGIKRLCQQPPGADKPIMTMDGYEQEDSFLYTDPTFSCSSFVAREPYTCPTCGFVNGYGNYCPQTHTGQ